MGHEWKEAFTRPGVHNWSFRERVVPDGYNGHRPMICRYCQARATKGADGNIQLNANNRKVCISSIIERYT